MRKFLAGGVGVAAGLMVVFGSGSASAINEYAGMTYEKASSRISSYGQTAVIATRIGEFLPTEQCIVTASHRSNSKVFLDLNCNDIYAGKSGHAGNSAATPQGAKVKDVIARAVQLSKNYANATAAGKEPVCATHTEYCQNVCQQSEACSAELTQFLGL